MDGPTGSCAATTTLTPRSRSSAKEIRAQRRHLDAIADHVAAFGDMLTGRHGHRLDAWIAAVEDDDLPELHSYTAGLKRDHAAVLNGLTLPHSSGVVESHVNRIKMIKRQVINAIKVAQYLPYLCRLGVPGARACGTIGMGIVSLAITARDARIRRGRARRPDTGGRPRPGRGTARAGTGRAGDVSAPRGASREAM